jgi:hypothetical protein
MPTTQKTTNDSHSNTRTSDCMKNSRHTIISIAIASPLPSPTFTKDELKLILT